MDSARLHEQQELYRTALFHEQNGDDQKAREIFNRILPKILVGEVSGNENVPENTHRPPRTIAQATNIAEEAIRLNAMFPVKR